MLITFDDFKKIDLRIGKILSAEKVEAADKLLKLEVDFGEDLSTGSGQVRQIVAGIAEFYHSEDLVGKECPFVINLESRTLKGVESQGMILAVSADGRPVLLFPEKEIAPGSIIK